MYIFGTIATALPDLDSSLPSDRQTSQGWSAKFQHDYSEYQRLIILVVVFWVFGSFSFSATLLEQP